MKVVSFRFQGRFHSGVMESDRLVPLLDLKSGEPMSLQDAIERGLSVANIGDFADKRRSMALNEIDILPPIVQPRKILCVGTNYESHQVESSREKQQTPQSLCGPPSLWLRMATLTLPA